jgi:DNA-binding MarR family transcriptional regulator
MLRVPPLIESGFRSDPVQGREVVRLVADLVSLVEPRLLALWRATGMTMSQRRVLRQLRDGPRSAGDIATALAITAPSLTRQLAKLEDRGLVVRRFDTNDRRRVLVELTSNGRGTLTHHRLFAGSPLARAARQLTPTQQQKMVESLNVLVELARELNKGNPDDC